jgi:uncharacterized membrane protein YeiH
MDELLSDDTLLTVLLTLEGVGVLAFAASGLLEAARKRLDLVGVVVVAFLTAFGGGTLRDVLLDRRPFFWVANEAWVWVVMGMALVIPLVLRARHLEPTLRAMQWPDAVGLGLFAASGTQIALGMGSSPLVATLMGVITAVFGGLIRDVMLNEMPWVISDYQLYSVIAFAGGLLVWGLGVLGMAPVVAVLISAASITVVRMLAMVFHWRLPGWKLEA